MFSATFAAYYFTYYFYGKSNSVHEASRAAYFLFEGA